MAFQTEKGSSSSQGPAPTAQPPPPPPNNNTDHNPFSPAGSPPLILAFLAIGLFAAAMVAVFGFRRVQLVRTFGVRGMANSFPPEESAIPRPKPQLWEVGLQDDGSWYKIAGYGAEKDGQSGGHWANMMPLAANAVTTTLSQLPKDSKPSVTSTTDRQQENILDNRIIGFSRGRMNGSWPHWRPVPMGRLDPQPPTTTTSSSEMQEDIEVSKTLQVGTIILMPSLNSPLYRKRTDRDDDKERKRDDCSIPDYSIGFYERDWR
jgi:hypothetical protein